MNKKLHDRLTKYALSAGAIAGVSSVNAQVLYTDVDPDTVVANPGNSYDLDLNNDSIKDFNISIFYTNYSSYGGLFNIVVGGVFITPMSSNAVAAGGGTSTYYGSTAIPYALGTNASIGSQMNFYGSSSMPLAYQGYYSIYGYNGSFSGGNFLNQQNKFIGLKLMLNGNAHYGWVRLDVNGVNQFVIKDYAVELTADASINTGQIELITAQAATNVLGEDVGDNKNGTDLRVSFDKASDEVGIEEYRILIVKAQDASSFNLSSAQNVALGNYISGTPNGSNVSVILSAGDKDVNGELIKEYQPYNIFILSAADGLQADLDTLSEMSPMVQLISTTGICKSPSSRISFSQIDNRIDILNFEGDPLKNISLTDMRGATVYKTSETSSYHTLETGKFASGFYILSIGENENQIQRKIFLR